MRIILLLVVFPFTGSVKHTLTYFITVSPGLGTFPQFVVVSTVDGVNVEYCDSNDNRPEPRQDWVKTLNTNDPEHRERHVQACVGINKFLTSVTSSVKLHFNQTGAVHVLQETFSCSMDKENGAIDGSDRFGYDGEDFVSLNLTKLAWVYAARAVTYRDKWAKDNNERFYKTKLTERCPECLERFILYGKSFLERKVPPSVSLLQTSPSSPVSCLATGFYPDRAEMFWRKDGEQIHKHVDQGEILPNHDGTFQMRVHLNLSSVKPEDRTKYDCVFRGSGAENDIITKLDKAVIRRNGGSSSLLPVAAVAVAVVLLLLVVSVAGLVRRRRRRSKGFLPTNTSDTSSSSDKTE